MVVIVVSDHREVNQQFAELDREAGTWVSQIVGSGVESVSMSSIG